MRPGDPYALLTSTSHDSYAPDGGGSDIDASSHPRREEIVR